MNTPVCASSFAEIYTPCRLQARGNRLALLLKQANLVENRYVSTLWILENGQLIPLEVGAEVEDFYWQDDLHLLLCLREKEEKDLTLYRYPLHSSDKLSHFASLPNEAETLLPLENGDFFYLARKPHGSLPKGALEEDHEDYVLLEEFPFWEEGSSFFCQRRRRIFLHKREGSAEALSPPSLEVEDYLLSKDGSLLWFIAKDISSPSCAGSKLFCLYTNSLHIEPLPSPFPLFAFHALCELQNHDLLIFGSDMQAHGLNQNGAFYRLCKQQKTYTTLYENGEYTCWSSIVSDMQAGGSACLCALDEQAFFISTKEGGAHLFSLDCQSGAISALPSSAGSIQEMALVENDLFYVALRGLWGPELYRLREENETRLSDWNHSFHSRYTLQPPQPVTLKSTHHTSLEGWILPPLQRCKEQKHAAILMIHGGPKMAYGPVLSHDMQYFSALGYAILFCNPRGSDGHANEFADIRGRYGCEDSEDILLFLDEVLLQNPWIDPSRIGICGGSYGGFMVNWLLCHTKRFAAAVSLRGISNWFSMAALSDIGHLFVPDQVCNPWQNPSTAFKKSPLRYVQNIQTPTLFLHGMLDRRCPPIESLQMYSALKQSGIPTRLCLFSHEGHSFFHSGKPRTRLCCLEEISSFFSLYL